MINTATGMKMISISALHDWTEANGYTYTDDTITAPNGTVVFPIESSEE